MISATGLAHGIDYSLSVLSRYREQRHRGQNKIDAITATGGTLARRSRSVLARSWWCCSTARGAAVLSSTDSRLEVWDTGIISDCVPCRSARSWGSDVSTRACHDSRRS